MAEAASVLPVSPVIPVGAPVPQVQFCPTGGISLASAPAYLALPNVACLGGSWLTPRNAIELQDWQQITRLAQGAASLSENPGPPRQAP